MTASTVVGEPDRQRMVGWDARRPEPTAGDLDRRGVVAQERVGGTGGRDGRAQLRLGVGGRLAEPDAVAAVRRHPVEHGRRPLPARDDADDRRVRQAERGHQRVGLGLVPAGLVRGERLAQDEQVVERRDALAPLRGVRRPAGHGQAERDGAGVGDDDVEVRRLGDDREVARHTGPDRGQRPLAAVLLGRDEGDDELAVEPVEVAAVAQCPDRARIAATPPFMSQAPRP